MFRSGQSPQTPRRRSAGPLHTVPGGRRHQPGAHGTRPAPAGGVPFFSYGALQSPQTQRAVLGRTLTGSPDRLPGFILTLTEITASAAGRDGARTHHPMAVLSSAEGTHVQGTLFHLLEEEADLLDGVCDAQFHRIPVTLASGTVAWALVDRRYRPAPAPSAGAADAVSA
ncbi:hypothetical protein GCM10010129_69420 [Streptomyces fumigatiscleroticus]|nr:hypothetical protein GCM10010129_69420 [Streptomyces fumigatiscleroticus]